LLTILHLQLLQHHHATSALPVFCLLFPQGESNLHRAEATFLSARFAGDLAATKAFLGHEHAGRLALCRTENLHEDIPLCLVI
jgi:hypothetical protein